MPRAPDAPEVAPADGIEWETVLWEAVAHLQAAIRIETVNPPGRELSLARYLDDVLRGAGIATRLLEPAPERASLTARIPGTGSARPLLLMAHMDVVGVQRDKWTANPFGGELLDRAVYGRGAIDDKGMLVTNLVTMLLVRRHVVAAGKELGRDIVFVATSDEEAGGEFGIDWLVANHPDVLDAEYALNEGGRIRLRGGAPEYCAVQCAEKVSNVLRLVARGPAGHASIPLPGNAIHKLARALVAIGAHVEPVVLSEVSRQFLAGLAAFWPDAHERAAMIDLVSDDAARAAAGAAVLRERPDLDAVLRNGISPTLLSAGVRTNVIPSDASATFSVRTLPDESLDALVARLHGVIGDDAVSLEIQSRGDDAPASPVSSPMMTAIRDAVHALAPGMATIPYLSTGATDSARLRRLGVHAYGLLPFPLSDDDLDRMHGHDERLPIASLSFGLKLSWEIVRRLAFPG